MEKAKLDAASNPRFYLLIGRVTNSKCTFNSPDDQYSIKLGRAYAKKVNWRTIYGGKNNIFRK